MNNLGPEEQILLQSELLPGESIAWSGKPNPRIIFHSSDAFLIPFSLLWGGFSIFWELGVSGIGFTKDPNPSYFMMLWGIPFVLAGQYFIWGRFLYAAWKKRRVLYAVTNRRVIVLVKPPQAKMITSYLDNVPTIERTIRPDGTGTLSFGSMPPVWSAGRTGNNTSLDGLFLSSGIPIFVDVDDAAAVFSTVNGVRERARTSAQ